MFDEGFRITAKQGVGSQQDFSNSIKLTYMFFPIDICVIRHDTTMLLGYKIILMHMPSILASILLNFKPNNNGRPMPNPATTGKFHTRFAGLNLKKSIYTIGQT
ncbi:hypothetical protein HP439_08895 [Sphingobacterium shayense]|uniref:hypothetical protein n=1 Tax=Sphingobacterium shayense TaxID=626343 RepID=UPI00155172DC|nr:hypothetical protein [Sphingobacterium shayense]NQD70832.1 hypothetical protein [Sphingobacterium shayense]